MNTNALRFIALLLAALAMGMHLAHALELLPKLQWDAALYFPVQTSLYRLFGSIGPVLEFGALIVVSVLAYTTRGSGAAFRYAAASSGAIVLALAIWAMFVMPANAHINAWLVAHEVPADWAQWRAQWQYGQASIFLVHLCGFSALIRAMTVHIREA